ncbi:Sugar transferase involved in LPS biosynthesis (colanic, teichoic acid) [Sulfitobacter marinus]|uniref:Sugar transferase involved in LPS biosynthesis (Colanic, teichoic acid) n=1 Tax=Sulfitobacter marinus TaxID=394264 RepID=A0A1I6VC62_9RHOB|nr:sugar transferase [Sulfitobacter marinus]SFT11267.1 Sugar transferase involved in LPS biosynthesis (colanic, teichoic acid) [Sulfitobacter marinus]
MIFHDFDTAAGPFNITRAQPLEPYKIDDGGPISLYRNGGKRLFDLLVCLAIAPLVLALVATCAVMIWLTGHRPFYSQFRIGLNGKVFKMWKLRSMVNNGDKVLARHLARNPAAILEWHCFQKLKNDPRVTRLGGFLRRTSLDELPQIWNVIKGEMSLVGPRPMMISQEPLYHGRDYYNLVPGISGNWQVSARNQADFVDRAAFDSDYSATLSLRGDLGILAKTVGVVLKANGH